MQHWFAEHPTAEFVPGKPVPVVVGVRNTGGSPFNITAAVATLNHPLNASIVVYNFTAQVCVGVGAGVCGPAGAGGRWNGGGRGAAGAGRQGGQGFTVCRDGAG